MLARTPCLVSRLATAPSRLVVAGAASRTSLRCFGNQCWQPSRGLSGLRFPPEHEDWLPEIVRLQQDKLQGVYSSSDLLREPKTVQIIGSPLAYGQPIMGVDLGPKCIREGGLHDKLVQEGWQVVDNGDIDLSGVPQNAEEVPDAKNAAAIGHCSKKLAQQTYRIRNDNDFCLTLGGDHSVAIGSLAGILKAHPDTGILWVDAHADINTPSGSVSKNVHGMVLSFLMNLENCRSTPGFEWLRDYPVLDPKRLVYIGLRDVEHSERAIIRALGVKTFTMHHLDGLGIGEVMRRSINHLTEGDEYGDRRPIHLSMDIDSIDPLVAPATGTRVHGGLSYREAFYLTEIAAQTRLLSSLDMVEVNPLLGNADDAKRTAEVAVGLIRTALGNRIV